MLTTYEAKLLSRNKLNSDTYFLQFTRPDEPKWTFAAGQYMIFHLSYPADHPLRRLYSIASPPENTTSLDFIIQKVPEGKGSPHITNLKPGETIKLQGPAGAFTFRQTPRDKIFLATGTGIAPIRSMLLSKLMSPPKKETDNPEKTLLKRLNYLGSQQRMYLFWGMRTCEEIYLLEEFKNLQKIHDNFRFTYCLSRDKDYLSKLQENASYATFGRVTVGLENLLLQYELDITKFDYYLCGGQQVVEGLRQYLTQKKVPTEQIFFERFN